MAGFMSMCSLVVFMISAIIDILIFTKGFLLTRIAITNSTHTSSSSVLPAKYNKAIVIVIDALRYDFVEYQPSSNAHYHNKLPFVRSLLTKEKQQTRLFKFIADPPTTTMQRLKGLTTGGLPTFVDAGSNFASAVINEDNIIQQLVSNNKTITFMGDDTWESLFSGRFLRSYPFPSFNVHDLHTVDQGVKSHLLPEIQREDYSLLIAHFLGVDHCGHRYGPNHPAMADKLAEMNDVIRSVVEAMDDDTLLVVLGDHGMTRTGDHGGESEAEINAALLVHTKRPGVWLAQQELEEVSQIDLVPTLSVLLGIPIPYSNLGSLVPELLYDLKAGVTESSLLQALSLNQQQISNYLHHYSKVSSDLPKPEMAVLQEMEDSLKLLAQSSVPGAQKLITKYMNYMRRAKTMCQQVWAKFDDNLMLIGCSQVLFCIMLRVAVVVGVVSSPASYSVMQGLLTFTSLTLCYLSIALSYGLIILTCLFLLIIIYCSFRSTRIALPSKLDIVSTVFLVLLCLSSLSNSLLVYEDRVTYFLVQSVLLLMWSVHIVNFMKQEQLKVKERATPPVTYMWRVFICPSTYLMLALSVVLRLSQAFRACREEQEGCEVSLFFTPLTNLQSELGNYKNMRFWFMSLPSVVLPAVAIKRILKVRGNLNGYSAMTFFLSYGLPLMALLVLMNWTTAATPILLDWQRTLFARTVYGLLLLAIVVTFVSPLAVYFSSGKPKSAPYSSSISSIYRYMKDGDNSSDEPERPLVYGLGTVYSAAYLTAVAAIVIYLMMIGGDGMSFSQLLLILAVLLFLDFHQITFEQPVMQTSSIICWFLMCKYYFYCSGQQPTITNIRWEAAFHGFAQDHNNHVFPAILLFTSTFSSQVLFTFLLPMLLIVTESCQTFYHSIRLPSGRSLTGLGEIVLSQQEERYDQKLHYFFSTYLLAHLLKSFGALCSAALLRRHLMVWKIFAPALIYESASFILTCVVSLITYLLFIRISKAVQKYTKNFDLERVD